MRTGLCGDPRQGRLVPDRWSRLAADAHQDGYAGEPVLPGDRLALVPGAAVVADRTLVRPDAQPQHLRGDLGIQPESPLVQVELADEVERKKLQTGVQVFQIRIEEDVREPGGGAAADRVVKRLVR